MPTEKKDLMYSDFEKSTPPDPERRRTWFSDFLREIRRRIFSKFNRAPYWEQPSVIVFRCPSCKKTMAIRYIQICPFCKKAEMMPMEAKEK